MEDDCGSENNLTQLEMTPFIRNPANCTAPYSVDKLQLSPFLGSMSSTTDLVLIRIKRQSSTSSSRSPWSIRMLSRRHECTFTFFYNVLLYNEAKIISNFNCPHIAGAVVLEGGQEQYKRHMAMEYCSNDLAYILSQRYNDELGPLEVPKAMKVVEGVLSGLDYLHTKALMMHGDLKSYNVLVQGDFENIKLCGLTQMSLKVAEDGVVLSGDELNAEDEGNTVALGLWSAPEVFEGKQAEITTKADIFSFGLVVFEMLVGYPPHTFPGVMDDTVAESDEVLNMRNPIPMDEDDGDCVMLADEAPRAKNMAAGPTVFARKRPSTPEERGERAHSGVIKKTKVVNSSGKRQDTIDLLHEEDDMPADGGHTAKEKENGTSINAKEENPSSTQQPASQTEKVTAAEEVTSTEVKVVTPVKEGSNATAKAETDGANEAIIAGIDKVVPAKMENTAAQNVATESTNASMGKDSSEEANMSDSGLVTRQPLKPIDDCTEVVMVLDSSDEEDGGGVVGRGKLRGGRAVKRHGDSYEEDSENDDFFDPDEYYEEEEGDDDCPVSDIDWELDEDDKFINYASLGTRPPIPSEIPLGPKYNRLLEIFVICTNAKPANRPSAAQLLTAIKEHADVTSTTPQSTAPEQPDKN
uniref:Protein kinase domain-containing protein n=1 Tax=Anopheles epiroticus TaxID=199890 RepID=A0A182PW02_9DIPT